MLIPACQLDAGPIAGHVASEKEAEERREKRRRKDMREKGDVSESKRRTANTCACEATGGGLIKRCEARVWSVCVLGQSEPKGSEGEHEQKKEK